MISRAQRLFTPEEYLTLERASSVKSEYLAGKIYAMSGGSPEHNILCANIVGELYRQLKGRPCLTYTSDMRVQVSATGLYTYPDVSVVCGEPIYGGDKRDLLLNPTVIVEVLSPSTAAYDRGEKWDHYRTLTTLKDYVLVAQDRMWIGRYCRRSEHEWLFVEVTMPGEVIDLASIGCTLQLSDVYDKIDPFPTPLEVGSSSV